MVEFLFSLFFELLHADIICWKLRNQVLSYKYVADFLLTSRFESFEILSHWLIFQLDRFSIYPILELESWMQEVVLLSL